MTSRVERAREVHELTAPLRRGLARPLRALSDGSRSAAPDTARVMVCLLAFRVAS